MRGTPRPATRALVDKRTIVLYSTEQFFDKAVWEYCHVANMLQRMGTLFYGSEPIGTVRASTGERAVATVRKRTWRNSKGEQTAWVADYFDQHGSRRIKTFAKKKEADAFLVTTQGEMARGVHTPESGSITVAEACEIWIERGELEKLERPH